MSTKVLLLDLEEQRRRAKHLSHCPSACRETEAAVSSDSLAAGNYANIHWKSGCGNLTTVQIELYITIRESFLDVEGDCKYNAVFLSEGEVTGENVTDMSVLEVHKVGGSLGERGWYTGSVHCKSVMRLQ